MEEPVPEALQPIGLTLVAPLVEPIESPLGLAGVLSRPHRQLHSLRGRGLRCSAPAHGPYGERGW